MFPAPTKPGSQPASSEPAKRGSGPAIPEPLKRSSQPAVPAPAKRGSQPAIPEPAKRTSHPAIPAPAKRGSQPAIPAPAKRTSEPVTAEPAKRTSQPQIATEQAVPDSAPGEHTAQTLMAPEPPRRDPEDLMRTFEQNPKLPGPRVDRTAQTPIPTVDAERAAHVPISTAPTSLPPPKQLESTQSGPTPACPQCESPMSWVDEHLRFYCRSCRMYF